MRRSAFAVVPSIVGLDLSLTGTAACALPVKWDHDLLKVRTLKAGERLSDNAPPVEQSLRRIRIVDDLVLFCEQRRAKAVFIEEYAFNANSRAHALGELGGTVKDGLYKRLGLVVTPIVASSARKTLLGTVPRNLGKGKTKKWIVKNVKRLGDRALGWSEDECDAFVIANAGLMLSGYVAMYFDGIWA